MKRFLTNIFCVFISFAAVAGICACGPEKSAEAVNLVAISGTDVGVMPDVDYYVVPEPAASARVKAIEGLDFAGSLQELYGSENGYPQAVIVAKKDLAQNTNFVHNFLMAVSNNTAWLLDEETSVEQIASAVTSHLTKDLTPTFSAKNLTKDVIKNCGIGLVSALDSKADIVSFMTEFNSVGASSFGMPDDSFFWDGNYNDVDCGKSVSVYAPDGAPALGIANVLAGEGNLSNVKFEIVDPSVINAKANADICILPVNAAVKLLGNGSSSMLVGTLTHGNLYLLAKNGVKLTCDNLNVLCGKTVGVVNLAAVPGLTFKVILKNQGIKYTELI